MIITIIINDNNNNNLVVFIKAQAHSIIKPTQKHKYNTKTIQTHKNSTSTQKLVNKQANKNTNIAISRKKRHK